MKLSGITEILGGEKILRKKIQSRMDLVELSDISVTKDALLNLANYLSFSIPVAYTSIIIRWHQTKFPSCFCIQ